MTPVKDSQVHLAEYTLLRLIREHGPVSQVRLSDLSGYSRSTVSINCDKLLQAGLIIPDRDLSKSKKKNAELSINGDVGLIIGIGMGGSRCKINLTNLNCDTLAYQAFLVDLAVGPEAILKQICKTIDELLAKYTSQPLLGIGIGLPTPVNYEKGVAYHPAFMPGWHLFPVKEYMTKRYGCLTVVDNEVNTMALAEYEEYKTKYSTLLCVKGGTGIGAGIIINGKIYRGENGGGGNIGHVIIEDNNTPCKCGKIGCLEAVASVPAILSQACEAARQKGSGILYERLEQHKDGNGSLTLADIKYAADHGDRDALSLIETAGLRLGSVLGRLLIFMDPGILIISGRMAILGPNYLDYIRKAVYKQASPWVGPDFQIIYSKFGDKSAAKGAALLCIQELFKHNYILQLKDQ